MVIGRSGCVIREMQQKTRTRIQIPSQPTPGEPNRIATISGPPDGCQQVKAMIDRMVMEQSSQSVMTGTNFTSNFMQPQVGGQVGQAQYSQVAGGYMQQPSNATYGSQYGQYQQQQQQYQTPYQGYAAQTTQASHYQPAQQAVGGAAGTSQQKNDYSVEWAAYFAAQAAQGGSAAAGTAGAAAAAAPTTTSASTISAPASTAAGTPASGTDSSASQDPTAYYDAFWRYAHYYGDEAARKYYGAWSPPVGTPSPYAQGGSSSQPQQENTIKDSSARKVSNLPAWMTKT